jgi:hypothetical protein
MAKDAPGHNSDTRYVTTLVLLIPSGLSLALKTGGVFQALGILSLGLGALLLILWCTERLRSK